MDTLAPNIWEYQLGLLESTITARLKNTIDNNDFIKQSFTALYKDFNSESLILSLEEHLLLMMAVAPHIKPGFFDEVIQKALPQAGDFPQLGGVRGKQFRGFLPTGETALFILAGDDLEKRFEIQELFSEDHFFAKKECFGLRMPLMMNQK